MSMGGGRGLAAFRDEAKECVLVCANCHGEIECGAIPSPPPQARFSHNAYRRPLATWPDLGLFLLTA